MLLDYYSTDRSTDGSHPPAIASALLFSPITDTPPGAGSPRAASFFVWPTRQSILGRTLRYLAYLGNERFQPALRRDQRASQPSDCASLDGRF
jgi:hypothetical protein